MTISVPEIRRAKIMLEQEAAPETFEETVEGLLYRADSKEHQFILEPIEREETKIVGTYSPALREEIRDAWDKVVRVRIRTTHYFLSGQVEPSDVTVELLAVEEISLSADEPSPAAPVVWLPAGAKDRSPLGPKPGASTSSATPADPTG